MADRVRELLDALNRLLDRWLWTRVTRDAVLGFVQHDVLQHAGAMAYFAILSLVNLLILGVVVASFLVGHGAAREFVIERVVQAFPLGPTDVANVIDRASEARGGVSLIGLLLLLWSALGVFSALSAGVGKVFASEPRAPFWRERAIGVALLAATGILAVASVALGIATQAIEQALADRLQLPGMAQLFAVVAFLVPIAIVFVAFVTVYRLVPTVRIAFADAAVGALLATVLWTILRIGFTFFATRIARYDSVFGPIGAAVGLLVFLYFSSVVLLLGAEAARATRRERRLASRAETPG